MKVVYGTPWIEVEFGQRDEGWKLYADRQEAIDGIKKDSAMGAYEDGGYCGPVRPLMVYEIPVECLEKETKAGIKKNGIAWSTNRWEPKFKDEGTRI